MIRTKIRCPICRGTDLYLIKEDGETIRECNACFRVLHIYYRQNLVKILFDFDGNAK